MEIGVLLLKAKPDEAVKFAIDGGFELVEIALENWVDSLSRAQMKSLYQRCQEHGVVLAAHAPSRDLQLGSLNEGIRKESMRQIQKAIDLSCGFARYLTVHTGYLPRFREIGMLERIVEALRVLLKKAHDCGITLCIENVHENSIDQLLDYIRLVDHDIPKLALDIAHVYTYANFSLSAAFRVLSPYIGTVHISDNDGENDLHLPLGAGSLNLWNAMSTLVSMNYQGSIVVEMINKEDAMRSQSYLINILQIISHSA